MKTEQSKRRRVYRGVLFAQTGIVKIQINILRDKCKIESANTHCFEETFILEQSLETGSTDFSRES